MENRQPKKKRMFYYTRRNGHVIKEHWHNTSNLITDLLQNHVDVHAFSCCHNSVAHPQKKMLLRIKEAGHTGTRTQPLVRKYVRIN
ncbi:hypothetical protein CEXT_146881 [Caerostris extrusa]|uniref:Uncharacterized protein n=1 Tax=Caerostris extrusa TaxID=172846 RepID=A0AAV4X8T8_CAEEX|nr:hypothetical protein CEXT_146881 [Caerostris extrusa]